MNYKSMNYEQLLNIVDENQKEMENLKFDIETIKSTIKTAWRCKVAAIEIHDMEQYQYQYEILEFELKIKQNRLDLLNNEYLLLDKINEISKKLDR